MASVFQFSTRAGTEGVTFYSNGVSGASRVVGVDGSPRRTRVVRYAFTAPAEGGYGVSVKFFCTGGIHGVAGVPLRFFVGTDPESHKMGGASLEYHGILTDTEDSTGSVLTGSAPDLLLLPGVAYYLWVFPGTDDLTDMRYYSWYRTPYDTVMNTITLVAGAGVVYVNGTKYQMYVGNSAGKGVLLLPYVGRADGSGAIITN